METMISPSDRKWMKKCLKEEFEERVKNDLTRDKSPYTITDEITRSREMESLLESMKQAFDKRRDEFTSSGNRPTDESRPRSWLSFGSSSDDPPSSPDKADDCSYVIDRISHDKPVHVRLAGYERLLDSEASNFGNNDRWDILLKTLGDGLIDDSRPVFEASLRVHAKLLQGSRCHDVHENLLNAFNAQFHSRKLRENLPNFNTGINFKLFIHEKLFRLMRLAINHHDELSRNLRPIDRVAEETIDRFVVFLSRQTFGNSSMGKNLTTSNVLAILEPQAHWSRRWIHGLATRNIVVAALAKSPDFLENIIDTATKGLAKPPDCLTLTVTDEPVEVFISGETVETATFLHAVNFLAQLTSHRAGRTLLTESPFDASTFASEFPVALLDCLNRLATSSSTSNGIYESCRAALVYALERSPGYADPRFHDVATSPLTDSSIDPTTIFRHTLDSLNHMLGTKEGVAHLIGDDVRRADVPEAPIDRYPVVVVIEHTSRLLEQPFAVMNVDHVVQLFQFVGNLYGVHGVYGIVEDTLRKHFFPAVAYLYGKMDKYAVGRESKTQYLDSAAKSMLLKIVSSPLGLRTLASEKAVFEELIRGSIAPLRAPWTSNEIISFVSSASYFDMGYDILTIDAPQSLSTILERVCSVLEDPKNFHDPWDNENLENFLHVISCLSLSSRCFVAFMAEPGYEDVNDEDSYPRSLRDLIKRSTNIDSPYHQLGLITINAIVWNLDICVYMMSEFELRDNMLKNQALCAYEIEEESEKKSVHIVDACSLLRHEILSNSYHVRYKLDVTTKEPEDCIIFSEFPPTENCRKILSLSRSSSSSELDDLLKDDKPGLRDIGWVLEVRKAHKNSPDPMKNSVLIDLLNQMRKAIPVEEWSENFKWAISGDDEKGDWSKEEDLCFDLALRYAEENCPLENIERANDDIKFFFEASHKFINYKRPNNFESFDWFLATVFIICGGNVDRCKIFVEQITRFPSAMYVWPIFGIAIDQNNGEEAATHILLGQHVEDVVDDELCTVNYALKNHCGIHWWMICSRLMAQCFWGVLPWTEIVHFIAICILHTADYVVYYCVSLLNYCQDRLMVDISKNKLWPDHMHFGNYRCHEQMEFIDRIGKRQRNRVLPTLMQRQLVKKVQEEMDE